MAEKKIGCLPVVEDDELIGLVTETDVLRYFAGVRGALAPRPELETEAGKRRRRAQRGGAERSPET
jgi:CBS domain-containing protein